MNTCPAVPSPSAHSIHGRDLPLAALPDDSPERSGLERFAGGLYFMTEKGQISACLPCVISANIIPAGWANASIWRPGDGGAMEESGANSGRDLSAAGRGVVVGGDNYGIASTGDNSVNTIVQVRVIGDAAELALVSEIEGREPPLLSLSRRLTWSAAR